jgi:hypothetical protein
MQREGEGYQHSKKKQRDGCLNRGRRAGSKMSIIPTELGSQFKTQSIPTRVQENYSIPNPKPDRKV